MYFLDITSLAETDIFEAAKYIKEQLLNPTAADNLIDTVEMAINSLSVMLSRHALVNDDSLAIEGIRFIPVKNYLIFYTIREERRTVVIQRFLHGRRDWIAILKGE